MTAIMFGALVLVAFTIAMATRDWRLKVVAGACLLVWLATQLIVEAGPSPSWWLDPAYTAFLFGLAFCIQARGRIERERGEPLAMWLLVPMGVEAIIAVSYVAELLFLSAIAQLVVVQVGFGVELLCLIIVGSRRLDLIGRVGQLVGSFTTPRSAAARSA